MSPPAALQSLSQKQVGEITAAKLQWSSYTQDQAQRGGRSYGRHDQRDSPSNRGTPEAKVRLDRLGAFGRAASRTFRDL
jgi:hypothetical protein